MEPVQSVSKIISEAKQAEMDDDYEQAIRLYERVISIDDLYEHAYTRLMIIYRRLQWYKEELSVINKGIKTFEKLYKHKAKSANSRKVADISNALLKSTGLADKKGNLLYDPEPVNSWKKRKIVVEKKLKK